MSDSDDDTSHSSTSPPVQAIAAPSGKRSLYGHFGLPDVSVVLDRNIFIDEHNEVFIRGAKKPRFARMQKPIIPVSKHVGSREKRFEDDDDGHLNYDIGDTIDTRYTLLGTLGKGTFSRVAKAFDKDREHLVALKIAKSRLACKENAESEINVLKLLYQHDPEGKFLWVKMYDYFECFGHVCITYEILGSSVYDFMKENDYTPYPIEQIRHIIYQLCLSVNELHKLNLAHTDLKPENIVFVNSDYSVSFCNVRRRQNRTVRKTDIKLIDFGSATYDFEDHESLIQTRHYRAPEVISGIRWSHACDIWSIGCILFELYTGNVIFPTSRDDEHLAMMERILGPLPESYCDVSKVAELIGETSGFCTKNLRSRCKPLRKHMAGLTKDDTDLFDLMEKMMQYEQGRRISLVEALNHPFLLKLPDDKKIR